MTGPVVAIDAMGGDHGPSVIVPACLDWMLRNPVPCLLLVGPPDELRPMIEDAPRTVRDRTEIVPATEVVAMDEPPGDALRRKKNSSMRIAVDLVKSGRAQAVVSAGNTGALMAISRFVLKTLAGIDRPAIISAIPALGGHTHMLDLGANADCTAEQLVQFAVMGTVVASDIHNIERPSVGLLNIGTEEIKGSDTLRMAGRMLAESELDYVGFVEGHDIMSGTVDVVVTDGFTGNVSLKTMEGAVRMLFAATQSELRGSWVRRLSSLAARPLLHSLQAKLDPRLYNGASLVGLQGIVIKSHGGADMFAFQNALRTAVVEIDKGVPSQIGELLSKQAILEKAG